MASNKNMVLISRKLCINMALLDGANLKICFIVFLCSLRRTDLVLNIFVSLILELCSLLYVFVYMYLVNFNISEE